MWINQFLDIDIYHLLQWFLAYSILGWLVESVYMSLCNKKITNRGFTKGPYCPIYGFGALGAYFILAPVSGNYFKLYVLGAILATAFEFVVAKLMLRVFGEVWWDYTEKPFNYKGILCLESTVAWGFYTVGLFAFLHNFIMQITESYSSKYGMLITKIVLVVFALDFLIQLIRSFHVDFSEKYELVLEKYKSFKARWY